MSEAYDVGSPEPSAAVPPRVMGVLNVTPDSFSDGGRFHDVDAAVAHGLRLAAEGADLVDVGGESTRPGATRPVVADELGRVVPVIAALAAEGVVVSVDTMRAEVAEAAVAAGAQVVNDVSGGLADARMLAAVAALDVTFVAMHWRAHSDRMQQLARYDEPGGVVAAVRRELGERAEAALAAGVAERQLVLDPGLGFAKLAAHNWELLAALEDPEGLGGLGLPLLVGASRKTFLGALLADAAGPRAVGEREAAGVAVTVLAAAAGAWGVRVHDVRAHRDALLAVQAVRDAREAVRR